MHLEDIPSLRSYLVKRLSTLSDADPAALSDYIIALLKHEKSPEEMKAFCINQLVDFLHANTEIFVTSLFTRLEAGQDEEDGATEEITSTTTQDIKNKSAASGSGEDERDPDRRYRRDKERERRSRSRSLGRRHERRDFDNKSSFAYSGASNRGRSYGNQPRPPRHQQQQQQNQNTMFRQSNRPYDDRMMGTHQRFKRSSIRLVVDKIPIEFCTIAKVNEYFQKFGNLLNITVHPEIQRARLEYGSEEEANAAYSCPDVIFGNRFVKVYWDNEDLPTATIIKSNPVTNTHHNNHHSMTNNSSYNGSGNTFTSASSGGNLSLPVTSAATISRIEAAQKKQEALKGMLELQRHKQELFVKYIAQQKELFALLENKNLTEIERQEMLKTLRSIDALLKSLNISPSSASEESSLPPSSLDISFKASKSDLAEDITDDQKGSTLNSSHVPILRGGPMAMTVGPYGRGGAAFRGGRGGGYYGRAAMDPKSSFAAHSLDLRPTAFIIEPIPPRIGRDISSIRKVFEPYGEIKNITIDRDAAIVSFTKRIDAEKANHYISKADFGDPFKVSWISSTPTTVTTTTSTMMELSPSAMPVESTSMTNTEGNAMINSTEEDQIAFDVDEDDSHWRR